MKQTVGVFLVVRNEEKRLADALIRVMPFVDAVAVCDQSSDDTTWEILQTFQQVSTIPFEIWQDKAHGYCEASKQKTADLLATDWLLYVDPDEIFPTEFLTQMHELIKTQDYDGILIDRQNYFEFEVFKNSPIEPKIMKVLHPKKESQLRLTRKAVSWFPEQIHVRVRIKRGDGKERILHLRYIIEHTKTLDEQHEDDRRYAEPVRQVERKEAEKHGY